MSNKKIELSQLKRLSLDEIKTYKVKAEERKAELVALKADAKKGITDEQQEELDAIAIFLVDVDDIIEEKMKQATAAYNVPKGEEKLVHLSIVKGRRFNPNTGKEESQPVIQKFTYGEFAVFKNNCQLLGYTVVKVLHDPYNEAHTLIKK